jgi:hypothetical protein
METDWRLAIVAISLCLPANAQTELAPLVKDGSDCYIQGDYQAARHSMEQAWAQR